MEQLSFLLTILELDAQKMAKDGDNVSSIIFPYAIYAVNI